MSVSVSFDGEGSITIDLRSGGRSQPRLSPAVRRWLRSRDISVQPKL